MFSTRSVVGMAEQSCVFNAERCGDGEAILFFHARRDGGGKAIVKSMIASIL